LSYSDKHLSSKVEESIPPDKDITTFFAITILIYDYLPGIDNV
jgi:hypothetical protein